MKDGFFAVDDECVTGVVATLEANDHVSAGREEVYYLALAFIAPLKTDDCGAAWRTSHDSVEVDHIGPGNVG